MKIFSFFLFLPTKMTYESENLEEFPEFCSIFFISTTNKNLFCKNSTNSLKFFAQSTSNFDMQIEHKMLQFMNYDSS